MESVLVAAVQSRKLDAVIHSHLDLSQKPLFMRLLK